MCDAPLSSRRPRLRRLAGPFVVAVAVGLGVSHGTLAILNGRVDNAANSFATTALYAPTSLTGTPSGHNASLGWGAGTNGNGYTVSGKSNGTSSSCNTAGLTIIGSASVTTYSDALRYQPQGTFFCYQAATTYGTWSSVQGNPMVAVQLGVVAASVQVANGGIATALDPGDTIVVTFNQAIATASGPSGTNSVCATSATGTAAVIVLGSTTTSGSCVGTETTNLGKVTGIGSTKNSRYNATYAWSNGNTTLTVTIGTRTVGTGNPTISGTATFNPTTAATKLTSATGAFHACDTNTGGGSCLPTVTGTV